MNKISRVGLFFGLSLALALAASGTPIRAQEEEELDDEGGRFGSLYAEIGYWVSQANGLEYFPATESPSPDPTATFRIGPDDATETEARYRVGYELSNNRGAVVLTWYAHEQDWELSRLSPGNFIYGESLAYPAFAGFANDGRADGFDAAGTTVLRDLRIDFYRTAFQNRRAVGRWFAGLRRVEHDRSQGAVYHAVLPPLPAYLPDPGDSFDLDPLADTAQLRSQFEGRGLEAGMDVYFPLWKDRLKIEAGFAFAALRGKFDSFYLSENHLYLTSGLLLDPIDYDLVFSDPVLIAQTEHAVYQEGLRASSESASADVQEIYLGLRWQPWRDLEVFAGFRSARYSNVGVDLRPTNVVVTGLTGVNTQDVTEVDRSATYEGFYGGVAYSF